MAVRLRVPDDGIEWIRHEAELVCSDIVSRRPTSALHGQVRAYTGYEEHAREVRTLREVASGDVVLLVSFGPVIAITDPHAEASVLHRSFVAGVHGRYATTEVPLRQHGLEIRLTPIAAYTLLGLPMNGLANRAVALDKVMGAFADELSERLAGLPTWAARFDHLDSVLPRLIGNGRPPAPSTVRAWRRLVETSGRLQVATLAAELGTTRKHLAERFREEIGVSPKTLSRILRFRSAFRLLDVGQLTLPEIALRCGYFDQAHLNRDFREFAGETPASFDRRRPGLVG
jgi:AraC-like DNA-binding protein